MDLDTGLVCLGVIGFSVVIVLLTSVFGMKETSYEEAVLQQRNQLTGVLPPVPKDKSTKKSKPVKKKSEKHKDSKNSGAKSDDDISRDDSKKQKDVEPSIQPEPQVVAVEKPSPPEKVPSASVIPSPQVEATTAPVTQSSTSNKKTESHKIAFKGSDQVITMDDGEAYALLTQRRVSTDLRPKKPILIHKNTDSETEADSGAPVHPGDRSNSFEAKHPKDELELIKHQKEKQAAAAKTTNGSPKVDSHVTPHISGDSDVTSPEMNGANPKKGVAPKIVVKKDKGSKTKAKFDLSAEKLTPKSLVESIKSLALNDEEIQAVINELLNRESDDPVSSSWSQKNDPMAHMKKLLTEKDQDLQKEKVNLEAAKARLAALRQEMLNEKSKQTSIANTIQHQTSEIQRLNGILIQTQEKHKNDLKSLQNSLQVKLAEERNVAAIRLQEETKRLKEVIKQLEANRASLEVIPRIQHEMDQLRNEKQQTDQRLSVLQKSYDDLIHKNQMQDDRIKNLMTARQSDEYSLNQQISELRNQLQETDSSRLKTLQDLENVRNDKNRLEADRQVLEQKLTLMQKEISDTTSKLKATIQDLTREKEEVEKTASRAESTVQDVNRLKEATDKYLEEIQQLKNSLGQRDDQISGLKQQLDNVEGECQKLRVTQDHLKSEEEAQNLSSQETIRKLEQEVQTLKESNERIISQKSKVESEQDDLKSQNKKLFDLISAFKPLEHETQMESALKELVEAARNSHLNDDLQMDNHNLKSQIDSLKSSLSQTEDELKEIQKKFEDEQKSWSEGKNCLEGETNRLSAENQKLKEDKRSLEAALKELQSLQSTCLEMEEKLRDLQTKLEGEEVSKRQLTAKCDEVSPDNSESRGPEALSKLNSVQEELEQKRQELERLDGEREQLSRLKSDLEETKDALEKEKKSCKELQIQNVKLKSLVKIGEDSLRAEQKRADDLQDQLKMRNGSVTTPCPTTNGSPPDASGASQDSHDHPSPDNNSLSNTSSTSLNQETNVG